MKKIININLSGRVIPIEDTAYEKLQAYIESLRRYFAKEEDKDEIINDIESRIAELMNEKIRKGAQSVTDADIDEIAASMGRPEDFEAEEADTTTSSSISPETTSGRKKSRGRLYRDTNDKFLGGVCSGIAAYLNIEPAIVRILYAIIAFGSFGFGLFAYILLWIFLPAKDVENPLGKRLYRNPDDRMLGGVAGGLAAYFNWETWVIRLIFVGPFLFSIFIGFLRGITFHYGFDFFPNIFFGSLSGTFIFAYIILWIVLPEARSTYEKMEMRGEKVDVNSIRQNMKDRVKEWGEEVKESAENLSSRAKEFAGTRGKAFASEAGRTVRGTGSGILHALGVLFKVFLLFVVGSIALGLFIAIIALIFAGVAWWPVNDFIWTSSSQHAYAWGVLIFFLFVPLVGFIIWLIRRITGVRSRHSYFGWTFSLLWAIGWISVVMFAVSITKDFRYSEKTETPISLTQPANGKMIVAVSEPALEYMGRFGWWDGDNDMEGWDMEGDTARLSAVRLTVKNSPDDEYHVTLRKYGYGRTEEEARARAEKMQYGVSSRDSVLDLGNGYTVDKESKFRGQQPEVEILVPVGKMIRFDASVHDKLSLVDFKIKRNWRKRNGVRVWTDEDDYYRRYRSDVDYVMGIDGNLKTANASSDRNVPDSTDEGYRYNKKTNTDTSEIQKEIDRKQEEIRSLNEKIKREREKSSGFRQESMDDEDNARASGSSIPVFSLAQTFF